MGLTDRTTRWAHLLTRWWLPAALYLLLSLAWLLVLPPWQGPDEPGHYEYALLFSRLGRPPTTQDRDEKVQAQIIQSLDAARFWERTRQEAPRPLPERFGDSPFLQRSGSQVGDERPLYYLPLALGYRHVSTPLRRLYLGRLWSAFLGFLAVLAATWGARRAWPERAYLRHGVPLLVATLPMPAFIHTILNTDALADAAAAWFVALSWVLLRTVDRNRRRRLWVPWLMLLVLAVAAKRTTFFLAPLAFAVPFLMPASPLRRHVRWLALAAGVGILVAAHFWFAPDRAARWYTGVHRVPAARVVGTGVDESAAFYLEDADTGTRVFLDQRLWPEVVETLRGRAVVLRARLRAKADTPWVCLSVVDGITRDDRCGPLGTKWEDWEVSHMVHPEATLLRVVVGIGDHGDPVPTGALFADNLRLTSTNDGANLLDNGDAERPAARLAPVLRYLQRGGKLPQTYFRALTDPKTYTLALARHEALVLAVLFTSFWGNYGWLQYPLPIPVYVLLALVTAVAMAGMARTLRSDHVPEDERPIFWFNVLALTLVLLQNLLPTVGTTWLPQGRYLFPALLPILAFGLTGLGAWTRTPAGRERLLWGVVLGGGALTVLSLVLVAVRMSP